VAEVLTRVSGILKRGEGLVLARITRDRGSTPRAAGARMIVLKNGEILGTIGGGLLEAEAIKKARQAFQEECTVVAEMDLKAEDAAGEGMLCGGKVEFVCEYVPPAADSIRVFEALNSEYADLKKVVLCTGLASRGGRLASVKRFLIHDNIHNASLVSPDVSDRLREMSRPLQGSALFELDGKRYVLDVVESPASLFVFGAGHVGKEVAALGANLGFRTVVIDDRAEFASHERFPAPVEVMVVDWYEGCFKEIEPDENSFVVIVTRGHAHDKTVLEQALRTKACYIGMIGSKRKRDAIYGALQEQGFTRDELARVRCPVGLPIDTETPEEIAVSIAGELIQERSQRRK